jgi:hypothetical protein
VILIFQTLLINFTTALSLLSVAILFTDFIAFNVCPQRFVFKQYAVRKTVDMSDVLEAQDIATLERFKHEDDLVDPLPRIFVDLLKARETRMAARDAAMASQRAAETHQKQVEALLKKEELLLEQLAAGGTDAALAEGQRMLDAVQEEISKVLPRRIAKQKAGQAAFTSVDVANAHRKSFSQQPNPLMMTSLQPTSMTFVTKTGAVASVTVQRPKTPTGLRPKTPTNDPESSPPAEQDSARVSAKRGMHGVVNALKLRRKSAVASPPAAAQASQDHRGVELPSAPAATKVPSFRPVGTIVQGAVATTAFTAVSSAVHKTAAAAPAIPEGVSGPVHKPKPIAALVATGQSQATSNDSNVEAMAAASGHDEVLSINLSEMLHRKK